MITYQEHTLSSVLDYFEKGFKPEKAKQKIIRVESFVDTLKGIVIFKIYTTEKP